ncbi:MAG: hypothetical protein A2Y66_01865 [Nitrospirae bacterium RBG_13_41_22]|nr:MAG: hypothetical protein A2Y66_01865 [Nitrospirae bacterium RBG_13_41_22]
MPAPYNLTDNPNPSGKHPGGTNPIFKTPQDMQSAIDDYFQRGVKVKQVIVGKGDKKQVVEIPVPTISGLCYYIGFDSRTSFYDYEKKPEFMHTVKKARLFIECEYESMLQGNNVVGAIFALKNMGWVDKQEIDSTGKMQIVVTYEDKKGNSDDQGEG